MPVYGLTVEGLVIKTIEVIIDELNENVRSALGASINVTDGTLARIKDIFAEKIAEVWELAEFVNAGQDPDSAEGAALDAICLITGTIREPATYSVVESILTGTPTSVIPSGSRAATASTGIEFQLTANETIVAATAWAGTTAYVAGDIRTNASNIYLCTIAGTSAGSGGPTTTDSAIVDGTVTWRYIGGGTGYVGVTMAAVETGPFTASAFDLTEIITPVSGWTSVNNTDDAVPGRNQETDEDLRVRRMDELARVGTSTIPAIQAAILDVEDVTTVTVFYNNSDTTDGDGMPPHSVECLIQGGEDADIFQALYDNIAAGIKTHGTETGIVTDTQGTDHTFKFSRPEEVTIHVIINVDVDEDKFPTDGATQIKEAIATWGDSQPTGMDVRSSAVQARAFEVAGVVGVTSCLIGTVDPPVASTTITINLRQLASYNTANIDVNVNNVTP